MGNDAVLITGASDGIGFETVKIYLENNYNVIAHYRKNPKKLKYTDCISDQSNTNTQTNTNLNPISAVVGNLQELNWKSVYKGFKEFELPIKDKDKIKLIKMDPGTSVPLHSHNGREYILVLDGSFSDEYGEYAKGDLQINDHNIKHHPSASKNEGCICLSITESDVVFYGPDTLHSESNPKRKFTRVSLEFRYNPK